MSNKAYDIINKIQRFLPAIASFYLVLVAAWGLPYGNEISKTIGGIAALLAVFLEIWTGVWKKDNVIEIHSISKEVEEMNNESMG